MAANLTHALVFLIPFGLCLVGFHGVFFYSNPWKKVASWVSLQAGLVLFLLVLSPSGNAMSRSLALLTAACGLAVGILLSVFCARIGDRPANAGPGSPSRRGK